MSVSGLSAQGNYLGIRGVLSQCSNGQTLLALAAAVYPPL